MTWESLNVREADGRARWDAAGRPIVPSLVVDGVAEPVLHVSQLADALGLAWTSSLPATTLAADALTLLEAWDRGIASLELPSLLEPTPSRGRSLRNLTVNVCHPFELLPVAWTSGEFPWDPDLDSEREAPLDTAAAIRDYAAGATRAWRSFLATTGPELDRRDPAVVTPRGDVPFSIVLDTQRWHVAYHLRQLEHVVGVPLLPPLDELALPAEVF